VMMIARPSTRTTSTLRKTMVVRLLFMCGTFQL
jgi:hypothetical protein